jgi:hypothetical protein
MAPGQLCAAYIVIAFNESSEANGRLYHVVAGIILPGPDSNFQQRFLYAAKSLKLDLCRRDRKTTNPYIEGLLSFRYILFRRPPATTDLLCPEVIDVHDNDRRFGLQGTACHRNYLITIWPTSGVLGLSSLPRQNNLNVHVIEIGIVETPLLKHLIPSGWECRLTSCPSATTPPNA